MAKHRIETWQSKLGTTGLNPLQVIQMQDAIKERKKQVRFEHGRLFYLKYKNSNHVYYRPERGFAPAGWLDIEKFLQD